MWKYRRNILQCFLIGRRKRILNPVWKLIEIEEACTLYRWDDPALATRITEIIRTHRQIPQYGYED
jgi:hypothetical protein